jgi:hypothetical protein
VGGVKIYPDAGNFFLRVRVWEASILQVEKFMKRAQKFHPRLLG